MVPADHAVDRDVVARIVALVNRVYAEAEKGLWLDGVERTTTEEVAAIVGAGELGVARLDGRLVGAVRIQRLGGDLAEFGMLVTDPDHRGLGIGRQLVAFAEDWARNQGCEWMQLELLVPQEWTHPAKEFLRDWYQRLGYLPVRTGRLEEAYPALAPRLATPSDFLIFQKGLWEAGTDAGRAPRPGYVALAGAAGSQLLWRPAQAPASPAEQAFGIRRASGGLSSLAPAGGLVALLIVWHA
jgi:GNAT superfamily N-acetyltransferase